MTDVSDEIVDSLAREFPLPDKQRLRDALEEALTAYQAEFATVVTRQITKGDSEIVKKDVLGLIQSIERLSKKWDKLPKHVRDSIAGHAAYRSNASWLVDSLPRSGPFQRMEAATKILRERLQLTDMVALLQAVAHVRHNEPKRGRPPRVELNAFAVVLARYWQDATGRRMAHNNRDGLGDPPALRFFSLCVKYLLDGSQYSRSELTSAIRAGGKNSKNAS